MKKHFARLLLPLGVLCAAAALLFYPTQAAAGAKRGIGYCVDILIPSHFPFMALSVFVVKSGLAASMGRLTAGPCRILFGLPGSAAAAIVMSMVGGYPVGARAVAALCRKSPRRKRRACSASASTPAPRSSSVWWGRAFCATPKLA
ncbi:MAG: nucleoside recognition domain-containing protein [Anaeromassilibacillus sp.]